MKTQRNLFKFNPEELRGNVAEILHFVLFQTTWAQAKGSGFLWRFDKRERMLFDVTEPNWRGIREIYVYVGLPE